MKLPGDMAAFFVSCATSSTASDTGPTGSGAEEADMAENAALQALDWAEDPNIDLVVAAPTEASDDTHDLLRAAAGRARRSVHAGPDTLEHLQQAAALLRRARDAACAASPD